MRLAEQRAALVEYGRRMVADGLTVGTSGNLSVRVGELVAVTPSAVPYDQVTAEAIAVVDLAGRPVQDGPPPSTEVPLHLAVYRHTDARAVVHTHPLYATALSVTRDEVPPVHYMIALLGGPVRVAPYAPFGSPELAERAVAALAGRHGVLMRNHGATTCGDTLDRAYQRSVYLEWVCRVYHHAHQLGEPRLLGPEQVAQAVAALDRYGRHDPGAPPGPP